VNDLTTALRTLADGDTPVSPGLADRALRRAQQRGRRRNVAGAALAVVLVAGAVLTSVRGTADHTPPTPPATRASSVLDQPRVNVLLLGTDAAPGRVGAHPDTVIVSSIDTRTGRTTLFDLPRNLERMPFRPGTPQARAFPDGFVCRNHECLLNDVWQWAEHDGAKFYPGATEPGLAATAEVVQQATGLRLDETVVVSPQGMEKLIDAVGGVDVTVGERLPIGGHTENPATTEWLEAGPQHLNGRQAVWFARSRWSTDDDNSRPARQQRLLTALLEQVDGAELARAFHRLTAASGEDRRTSIRPADLPRWVELAARMKGARVVVVGLGPGSRSDPDYPGLRDVVRRTLAGDEAAGNPYDPGR
jgi:polyisoprenyl-teichoic acid--peptidoglycan teichoic acid transferase